MTSFENDQLKPDASKLGKVIETSAFLIASGGFLALMFGLFRVSVSLIVIGAMALVIGLCGGIISMVLRFVGRRSR